MVEVLGAAEVGKVEGEARQVAAAAAEVGKEEGEARQVAAAAEAVAVMEDKAAVAAEVLVLMEDKAEADKGAEVRVAYALLTEAKVADKGKEEE